MLGRWLRMLAIFLLATNVAMAAADRKMSVAFVHPGTADDPFWIMTSDFMYAVARSLDIDLKIYFARGNDQVMVQLVERLARSRDKPNYLMLTNHHGLGPKMMESAAKYKVPVMLVIEGLTEQQLPTIKQNVMDNVVGSMVGNYREAAYYMARNLLQRAAKMDAWRNRFSFRLVAINGDQQWSPAHQVELGLLDAVEEFPLVTMDGVRYGNWSTDEAQKIIQDVYDKNQEINFIWAASDAMGIAAYQEAMKIQETSGRVIKNQVLTAGMGWTPQGLDALEKGEFVVNYGGTFMLGGWGLVVLHDIFHGKNFPVASRLWTLGVPQPMNQSGLIDYRARFPEQDWGRIDFTKFSKHLNPALQRYNFSLDTVYANVDAELKLRAQKAAQAQDRRKLKQQQPPAKP